MDSAITGMSISLGIWEPPRQDERKEERSKRKVVLL
jgi:hypothetical protein